MSRNLVFQLYSTPEQAEETHSALAREVAKVPELASVRLEFEQDAGVGFDMHLTWAQQHPNQDAGDRGYYYLRVESPTELPDRVLEGVEEKVWDWIDETYNADSDEIIEVRAASMIEPESTD
ncbi:hypothetical protein [Nocardia cyriacigeorgica]|uniref:hypothetical protein n=1 Tax=Nocardia cyriacigeorgica TaxID=135487 RepID=UPI0024584411|nr:hypothetical protein [Nocardia cyriacigeorgica]